MTSASTIFASSSCASSIASSKDSPLETPRAVSRSPSVRETWIPQAPGVPGPFRTRGEWPDDRHDHAGITKDIDPVHSPSIDVLRWAHAASA